MILDHVYFIMLKFAYLLFQVLCTCQITNAIHPNHAYDRPLFLIGGMSKRDNAFKGYVVFNNTNIEDLTMNSSNQAWWGSHETDMHS